MEAADEVRILVVDDEVSARQALSDALEELGYTVRMAGSGAEALKLAAEGDFTIALLDVRLPDVFGIDLLRRLKASYPSLACVMVTAYASVATSVEALNQGASAYIMKPFDMAEVMAVIREQAEKRRLARENERMLRALRALQAVNDIALSTLELGMLPARLLDCMVTSIGGASGALVLVEDEWGRSVAPFLVGKGNGDQAMQAVRERAPVLGSAEGDAACLALPLLTHGRCIGGVEVCAPAGSCFTEGDLLLARHLADRAALGLENARLHERERRAAREAHTLLRVAEQLVSALHLDERLLIIARTLAQVAGASRCLIFQQRGSGLTAARAFGITADETATFSEMRTDILTLDNAFRDAAETGRTTSVSGDTVASHETRAFLSLWHIRSALLVPLSLGSQPIGLAVVYTPDQERQVPAHDRRLCEAVASQAAIAIENAREFEHQLGIAERLQTALLPSVPSYHGNLRLAARYYPALAEARVGGDFYDIFDLPGERIGLLMADVSGKGIRAAVHTAMGKYMLRAFAHECTDPAAVMSRLNSALHTYAAREAFITMFLGIIEQASGRMLYVNAGHPPALLLRAGSAGRLLRLGSTSPPVGAFPDADFVVDCATIGSGDTLFLYTDGVTEARADDEFFGVERLEDVLLQHAGQDPDDIADAVHAAVREFAGRTARDDIALVAARATAQPTTPPPTPA